MKPFAALPPRDRRPRPRGKVALLLGATLLATTVAASASRSVGAPTRDTDPRFGDARLSTGIRIRYAEQGDATGTPIILLHGFTDSWFSFSRVLPALAATHRVFAIDQRGHGDSERPAGGYSLASLAADVVAFMDATGIARATVIGHSMGSLVAQQDSLLAALPGATLAVYAGTGHGPHWEEPERFVRDVERFLAAPVRADSVPLYDDLGDHTHPITTRQPLAQRYFDQGLRLTYGFNHAEAIRAFRAAQRLDPQCAMCYWGEALAFGPNINAGMDSTSGAAAYRAIEAARARVAGVSAEERALVAAMAARYGADPVTGRKARDSAYARAMRDVARRFPASDDAAVLHAESEMLLSPWDYWAPGKQPKPNARRALDALERVLARNPDHAGACHYFIHAVEAAYPARALPCAERLPSLMPGAGHVVHMPAHIYIRVGRYADAVDRNVHALHADDQHVADLAPDGVYRLMYNPHNDHFLWFAATMAGREAQALAAARQTARKANPDLMRKPGLVALQHYLVTPLFALVRFGRWDAVLAEPAPPPDLAYPTGIWHYARALALSAKGQASEAQGELAALRRSRATAGIEKMLIWDLNSAAAVLDVAIASVEGELAARRGDRSGAITSLRRAVALEDAMAYDEPPTWHLSVRHHLGDVLLTAGRAREAERVYREDLDRHPENGWALTGLAESLRRQGRTREAEAAAARLKAAWATADVAPTASRF